MAKRKIRMQYCRARFTLMAAWEAFCRQEVRPELWTAGVHREGWWVFVLRGTR